MKLAFKIDVDTCQGTKKGARNLADLFASQGIPATFLFSLGKDQTGRSITRVFQKGFIAKCLKSNVSGNYGKRTLMYGTLLPSPVIYKSCADIIAGVHAQGFECGVHSWNHYKWQNKVRKMTPAAARAEFKMAFDALNEIIGGKCVSCGSAGWQVVPAYFAAQDEFGLLYASDVRGSYPFIPRFEGKVYNTLQIPSTLYTLDEVLCDIPLVDAAGAYLADMKKADAQGRVSVMTIHAELEGMAYAEWFADFLKLLKRSGVEFVGLRDYAERLLQDRESIPICDVEMTEFYNRSGLLATQH